MLRGLAFAITSVLRCVIPCKVYGKENIKKNNTVYMCNHQSITDIIVLLSVLPLKTHFIAKKEIFKVRLFAFILKCARVFPVDRETADLKAIKHACDIVKAGDNLLIFPQGTRTDSPEVKAEDMHSGAGMIALRAKGNVVPMMFASKPRFFHKNVLYIGTAMDTSELEGKRINTELLDEFTRRACDAMNGLLEDKK